MTIFGIELVKLCGIVGNILPQMQQFKNTTEGLVIT